MIKDDNDALLDYRICILLATKYEVLGNPAFLIKYAGFGVR